jgi:hypothetical protein
MSAYSNNTLLLEIQLLVPDICPARQNKQPVSNQEEEKEEENSSLSDSPDNMYGNLRRINVQVFHSEAIFKTFLDFS